LCLLEASIYACWCRLGRQHEKIYMDPKEMHHGQGENLELALVLGLVRGLFRHESCKELVPHTTIYPSFSTLLLLMRGTDQLL